MANADWEVVFTTSDQVEAEVVRGLLVTSGIEVVVVRRGLKAFETFLGATAAGTLELKVPPDRAEEAAALLEAAPEED